MADKEEVKKNLEYTRGYRDALVDTWEEVRKMATKGYSPQEMQIIAKTKSYDTIQKIESEITILEADLGQDDIIEIEDIPPEVEPIMEIHMSPRTTYLVKEQKPTRCYDMMLKEIGKNRPILIIARTPAIEIRERYDIDKSLVIWLTMSEKILDNLPPSALGVVEAARDISSTNDEYVKPGELPKLFSLAVNFIDGHNDGVILFEGFEYLATHNSFQSLMNFLQKLNENIVQKDFNLVLSVNPAAFEPKELSQLESEMSIIL